ncbi:MAG: flagellar biosynthesis anti-sigma factor FlgM [Pirellulaceae bacterium]|jgi:flagellar biosynthesis anti-sigma factor FlgM|nr:flagellar biosynthesis anti-sigma factor FlgM [Pirellulaceae bacterium]
MQINSLQSTTATQSVNRSQPLQAGGKPDGASPIRSAASDELELSSEAQQISQAQALGQTDRASDGIRTEKVAALREAISNGTYETTENLSAALDKLLDTLA